MIYTADFLTIFASMSGVRNSAIALERSTPNRAASVVLTRRWFTQYCVVLGIRYIRAWRDDHLVVLTRFHTVNSFILRGTQALETCFVVSIGYARGSVPTPGVRALIFGHGDYYGLRHD